MLADDEQQKKGYRYMALQRILAGPAAGSHKKVCGCLAGRDSPAYAETGFGERRNTTVIV